MESEVKFIEENANTVYVSHPKASYGIFCYNKSGDLFLNSDWGFYGYAWRAYGENFRDFLSHTNAEYIMGKFEINYNLMGGKKKMNENHIKNVTILINELIQFLRKTSNQNS